MEMTTEQIAQAALALPNAARAQLAERLAESLDPAEDSAVHALWSAEAIRRRDAVRQGLIQTIPATEVLARVRGAIA